MLALLAGGSTELFPNSGKPEPRRGVNPGSGLDSVLASASTCTAGGGSQSSTPSVHREMERREDRRTLSCPIAPSLPNWTTLVTLPWPGRLRLTSWNTLKESTPINERWIGEEVPGRVVYSSFQRPSSLPLAVGA